ncbi:GNAT family N-acetyltransferase [Nocardioides bruguierae]|uniref:GNAT family N-acetyltransferase n=1 Tax=Nocardioides bruguierae TaxID=2945102 RepID=A0A9X2D8J4_9ACTN|nr:GNAT family N-acetyltransferase [Nocardioides bruguierae]MCM0620024.1 GNAT family N-acetyltransferase [Nocardioides bruguierae]
MTSQRPLREEALSGSERLDAATHLLQAARVAEPVGGVWEAADPQWWSRRPRPSDDVPTTFWFSGREPVAGVLLTAEQDDAWQCDPVVTQGSSADPADVWDRALAEARAAAGEGAVEVPVADDDAVGRAQAARLGLVAGHGDDTGWLDLTAALPVAALAEGYRLSSREHLSGRHHLALRNGPDVADGLTATSLYDPALDLVALAPDGSVAGYALLWPDPVTGVALVEPVRVEEAHQRRGLARAVLAHGLALAAARGLARAKVSWSSQAAGGLYTGLGFVPTSTTTWFRG